ncbi:MAG: hypothetical protein EOO05_12350 [Chitinophagaceae bacterium]|nr:MAG: hypothetical protein EOO05_12350 [Chitinophagaceae bacterium]
MENTSWNLEDFVDSLVVELDKTRETLSIKAINKPLTYTVKDMSLDLNIFPTYDGDQIKFVTAQPGQTGASKVTLQLGSITDQQVRATSKTQGKPGDVSINEIEVDKTTQKELRKMGVTSIDDLQEIENKNINIEKASDKKIDYSKLINQLKQVKRNSNPPKVKSVSLSMDNNRGEPYLVVKGENLGVNADFRPVAVFNDTLVRVAEHNQEEIRIHIPDANKFKATNDLVLTLDPYAIIKMNVKI